MAESNSLADLLKTVEDLKRAGTMQIDIVILANLLSKMNKENMADADAATLAGQRHHDIEVWKAQMSALSATSVEMFKSVIEAGQTALKSAIVINGGAAAAMLALLAEALKSGTGGQILSPLGYAWLSFMIGLGLTGLATAVRYVSQACYAEVTRQEHIPKQKRFNKLGDALRNIALILGIVSFILFFLGCYKVFSVMQSMSKSAATTTAPAALFSPQHPSNKSKSM